jgi:hypothetical protein
VFWYLHACDVVNDAYCLLPWSISDLNIRLFCWCLLLCLFWFGVGILKCGYWVVTRGINGSGHIILLLFLFDPNLTRLNSS